VVAEGKLYPDKVCFWRKCAFCGINSKFFENVDVASEPIDDKIHTIREHCENENGVKFFWFYDEAVSAELLREFAQAVVKSDVSFIWHIRSRLEGSFDSELCSLLYRSGLREIRFGLESASPEVQKTINKFERFDLAEIESIVENMANAGIGVHFPCIVGFPGETKAQRYETYNFLLGLRKRYGSLLTFNINVLELDVGSDFYKNPSKYGINDITLPCEEEHFLGNLAQSWSYENSDFDRVELSREQEAVMRVLYPFIKGASFVPVRIFYRLIENMRKTLVIRSWSS
jgi:radical SAM superfamily enzyme YgiQ (UPF0313 family)